MVVADLLNKTETELVTMLETIGNEPIDWTPVILAELTRRAVVRLGETSQNIATSSRCLEKLTGWLIVLTIALGIVALPPTVELLQDYSGNGLSGRASVAKHRKSGSTG